MSATLVSATGASCCPGMYSAGVRGGVKRGSSTRRRDVCGAVFDDVLVAIW